MPIPLGQPRVYPLQFAFAVRDLIPTMKRYRSGQPDVPQTQWWPTALDIYREPWGTTDVFQFADIASLYAYLRKSKKLKIPDEWRHLVPDSL